MRLTFFGSSLVSTYRNGAASYYRGLLAALADLGHDIVFCEPADAEREAHRDLTQDPPYARVTVYGSEAERDTLVRTALEESDWVLKCSRVGTWDAELEWAISRLKGRARTAYWDMEAPATLARLAADPRDPLRDALPRFDRVFTYGGGPRVVDGYTSVGARACTPIYNGLDPRVHHVPEPLPEVRWDVLFMGNRHPDREERVAEFFFGAAGKAPEARFALAGAGWEGVSMADNVEYLGHVPPAEHNRVNRTARLVLNVHRQSMVESGWSPATRMFEAAGAAACQITDPWRGLNEFFARGKEILVAESGAEVARLMRDIGAERAASIGWAAARRALTEHTYDRRAAQVAALLGQEAREARPLEVV
ncbi:MAG: glycosyltransferase [Gemmatimonadota bacterium]